MTYGAFFLLVAAALVWTALDQTIMPLALLLGYAALAPTLLGIAYLTRRPKRLGKSASGQVSMATTLVLLPYLALQHAVFRWTRALSLPPSRITPAIVLGPRLYGHETDVLDTFGVDAVLDLTAEFAEAPALVRGRAYCCVATLDGVPLGQRELSEAVSWIARQTGCTYIHCAQGHGRSAAVVAAWLVVSGRCGTLEQAQALLADARPRARPTKAQWRSVARYLASLSARR